MKRILNLFFALAICFSFVACTDNDDEQYIIDIHKSDDSMSVTVSVPYVENMSYVNIFRKDSEDDIFNIAQIIPAAKNKNMSYSFTDKLVLNGKKYRYMARFRVDNLYKTTDWSDEVEISQTSPIYASGDPKPVLSNDDCYFAYDETSAALTFVSEADDGSGSISLPTESDFSEFNLGLAVSNGDASTVLRLALAGSDYTTDSTAVFLRSILPSDYFDRQITLKGVVCQFVSKKYQTEGDDTTQLRYTTVQWTAPLELRVKIEDKDVDSFRVNLKTSDEENYDFSDTGAESSRAAYINSENSFLPSFTLDY